MRPFTNNEFSRMSQQAESRMASKSEVGFVCRYVDSVNGPTDPIEWVEDGYIADFRFGSFGEPSTQGAGVPITLDTMTATCTMPTRYYTQGRFISREAPDIRAMGKGFGLQILHSGSNFMTNGEISCFGLVLKNVNGIAPGFFTDLHWNLITEPIILADSVFLSLQATEVLSVRAWMSAGNVPLPRHGVLIGDEVVFGDF